MEHKTWSYTQLECLIQEPKSKKICFIAYPSDYKNIHSTIFSIKKVLNKKGFELVKLDESLVSEEHQYEKLFELMQGCCLGVVILDGMRPNVIFEYGLLKGLGKPCIVLLENNALVDLSRFLDRDQLCKNNSPKVDIDRQFSDIKGKFYKKYNENEPDKIIKIFDNEFENLREKIYYELLKIIFPDKPHNIPALLKLINLDNKDELSQQDEFDFKDALKEIRTSVEESEILNLSAYYSLVGNLYEKFNQIDEALTELDKGLKRCPQDIDLLMDKIS